MPAFASTDELHDVVGGFYRYVAREEIGQLASGADLIVAFELREPDGRIVLDAKSPEPGASIAVHCGAGGPKPDVTFAATADAAERLFTGQITVVQAMATGQIRARGAVHRALRLVPAISHWIPVYREWRARSPERRTS